MQVAFYAPLKPPDHPVPSGDRYMARLLIRALAATGHGVELASSLQSFLPTSDEAAYEAIAQQAATEAEAIAARWQRSEPPGLWFTYHPYYKAPDLLGPRLCRDFGIAYATAEASYSSRRNAGSWGKSQALLLDALRLAQVNICFTKRDCDGLTAVAPSARFGSIAPFIDTSGYEGLSRSGSGNRLITVAMMRKGDKFESYRMLAAALQMVVDIPWSLTIAGGGKLHAEVKELFSPFAADRIAWMGEVPPDAVPVLLANADIYVWPGCGEAYGLAYLEAQAAGLPVIAQNTAGVPEVVTNGVTGLLTPEEDVAAFAAAIRHLLANRDMRLAMSSSARGKVFAEHSLPTAAHRLATLLENGR
jgi:glycosyltransferase involved in cell wall biosynthesis